jgi:hypothetical protein
MVERFFPIPGGAHDLHAVKGKPSPVETGCGITRIEVAHDTVETCECGDVVDFPTRCSLALTVTFALMRTKKSSMASPVGPFRRITRHQLLRR